jgi:hypothetical protein
MGKAAPLQQVKAEHGSKEKLVEKIVGLLERGEESTEELTKRLRAAANAKLLRLYDTAKEVKERFGSKQELARTVATQAGHGKDHDYQASLGTSTIGRLTDLYRSAERRAKRVSAKAKSAATKASGAAAKASDKLVKSAKRTAKSAIRTK